MWKIAAVEYDSPLDQEWNYRKIAHRKRNKTRLSCYHELSSGCTAEYKSIVYVVVVFIVATICGE